MSFSNKLNLIVGNKRWFKQNNTLRIIQCYEKHPCWGGVIRQAGREADCHCHHEVIWHVLFFTYSAQLLLFFTYSAPIEVVYVQKEHAPSTTSTSNNGCTDYKPGIIDKTVTIKKKKRRQQISSKPNSLPYSEELRSTCTSNKEVDSKQIPVLWYNNQ